MSRVAITEYAAKKLVLGDVYTGITVTPETVDEAVDKALENTVYIVKIDVGIKKRGKQGLVRVNIKKNGLKQALSELFSLGFGRCIIEEMVPHETSQEHYLSIDVLRDAASVLYSESGGVEIEENSDKIERSLIPRAEVLAGKTTLEINGVPLDELLAAMQQYHISFIEINPFILKNGSFNALDMAAEIDDAKASKLPVWAHEHIIKRATTKQEEAVQAQDEITAAALTLKTLNKNGSILTLLSGGGASLVAMDSLVTAGLQDEVINYSEYSGAPTRDETSTYAKTLLEVLFASTSPKKVILIAGGVANFTDIMVTFAGLVDAFESVVDTLKAQRVYVCIRRGGPNQEKGLAHLRDFLSKNDIPHDVHGPDLSLGEVGTLIKTHI